MADVEVPANHWTALKRSANCYVPHIVAAAGGSPGFTNTNLQKAAERIPLSGFSLQLVGKIIRLEAVTHKKAEECRQAYEMLAAERGDLPPSEEMVIVSALFGMPRLAEFMKDAGADNHELARTSKVSESAIVHCLARGRATAGIVASLHSTLATALPLSEFCSSRPISSVGELSAGTKAPFTLSDLLLPIPDSAPKVWP